MYLYTGYEQEKRNLEKIKSLSKNGELTRYERDCMKELQTLSCKEALSSAEQYRFRKLWDMKCSLEADGLY